MAVMLGKGKHFREDARGRSLRVARCKDYSQKEQLEKGCIASSSLTSVAVAVKHFKASISCSSDVGGELHLHSGTTASDMEKGLWPVPGRLPNPGTTGLPGLGTSQVKLTDCCSLPSTLLITSPPMFPPLAVCQNLQRGGAGLRLSHDAGK